MRVNAGPSDPEEASIVDAVAERLAKTDGPLPLVTLGTGLRKAGVPVKNNVLGQLLKRLAREGRVFEHPIGRQSRNPSRRYWHRSAKEYVDRALSEALARGGE